MIFEAVQGAGNKQNIINAVGTSLRVPTSDGGIRLNKISGNTHKSKNLLNGTYVAVTADKGITSTKNSDGSISLKGTCSLELNNTILSSIYYTVTNDSKYCVKFVGTVTNQLFCTLRYTDGSQVAAYINSDGSGVFEYNMQKDKVVKDIYVWASANTNIDITIYPMITTDLDATYDDFEPYGITSAGERDNAIVIKEHGNSDDTYTVSVPLTEPLRGINDVKDYIDKDGVHRLIGCVDLGTLYWSYNSDTKRFNSSILSNIKTPSVKSELANMICDRYDSKTADDTFYGNKGIAIHPNGSLLVFDDTYTDADTFKSAMSGVMLYYELETQTVTHLTEEQFKAIHSLKAFNEVTYLDTTDTLAKAELDIDYSKTQSLALQNENNIAISKVNFQDGVDSVYNALVSAGPTPFSKALTDVVSSIYEMNKKNTTVTASEVTQDDDYTYLTIPTNGYYNTSSKVRTQNSNLKSTYLGCGTSIDVKNIFPEKYIDFTVDDFIIMPNTGSKSDDFESGSLSRGTSVKLTRNFSYDNSIGLLNCSYTASGGLHEQSSANHDISVTVPCDVYLK